MISRWLEFVSRGKTESGKTRMWGVYSTKGEDPMLLGEVRWHGAWRKYSFFPEALTVFEDECLRDLSFFIEQATRKHRLK